MIQHDIKPAREQHAMDIAPFHCYEFDDGTVWTEFYRSGKDYLLRFPELADFEVSADGTVVSSYPVPDCDANTLEHLFVNQLVPLALSRQGQPTFHASVVTVTGGAVAFLGQSGAGKSTLAASFALDGAAFLTDDALIIDERDDGCRARPSHASLRLWDDSVEAMISDDVLRAGPVSYTPKARLLAGDRLNFSDRPEPLLAAYVLQTQSTNAISINALTGVDRYMGWLSNAFLLDIEDHYLLSAHFEWTHRVCGSVPTFELAYPHDYGMLPDVRDTVRQHVLDLCRSK